MKVIKILGHPVMFLSLSMLLIIEGEHFGGFYLLYLLFGLTYGAAFSLLFVSGALTLTIYLNIKKWKTLPLKFLTKLVGFVLVLASIYIFFASSTIDQHTTFTDTIPVLSFCFFGISCLCFIANMVAVLFKRSDP